MNYKKLIIAIVAVVIAALVIGVALSKRGHAPANGGVENTQTEQSAAQPEIPGKNDDAADQNPAVKDETKAQGESKTPAKTQEAESAGEQKVYTPTFMFFYSESDGENSATQGILKELQEKYSNITFDIRNIDTDPEMAERYSVKGMTPALIMLNTKNDISAFIPLCKEREKMEQAIENSMK